MRGMKVLIPGLILIGGLLFSTNASFGKAEYTKKEKKSCTACHTSAKSPDLNNVGKCYEKKKSLEGCESK
jgi:hypothetical protein